MKTVLALGALAALAAAATGSQIVYTQSFDGPLGSEWSGVKTTESVFNFDGKGSNGQAFSGNLLRNASVGNTAGASRLTLTGLAAHTSVSIGFLFAAIDSWDGLGHVTGGVTFLADYFNVRLDGVTVFQKSFANAGGVGNYTAPAGGLIAGAANPGSMGARDYGWGGWVDSAYNLHLEPSLQNIAHSSSTLTLEFFASGPGWQGGDDESWGIDNLVIMTGTTPVPAPGPAALGALALAAMTGRRRR